MQGQCKPSTNSMALAASIAKQESELIEKLRKKYPQKGSDAGVLLQEILHGEDSKQRLQAVFAFNNRRYKRGFVQLRRLFETEATQFQVIGDDSDFERADFIRYLLESFGFIDTFQSHQFLMEVFENGNEKYNKLNEALVQWQWGNMRAHSIDAMAYEKEYFDTEFVVGLLEPDADHHYLCNALFGIMLHYIKIEGSIDARSRIAPLLEHENPRVRSYALDTIGYRSNFDLIEKMVNDESPEVREMALQRIATLTESDAELLLQEILHGEDINLRNQAVVAFTNKGYFQGFLQLKDLFESEASQFQAVDDESDATRWTFISNLLDCFGAMDTFQSHQLLLEVLDGGNEKYSKLNDFLIKRQIYDVRAMALDAMAFEEVFFDTANVAGFLKPDACPHYLLNALYGLMRHGYRISHPEESRMRIMPLLEHSSEKVRYYALETIGYGMENLDLIKKMVNDPDESVRGLAVEMLESLSESEQG